MYKFYHGPQDDIKLFIGNGVLGIIFSFGDLAFTYDSGFLNSIADPAIGGLYITLIACFSNLSGILPSTLGTYVVKYVDYDVYMIGCLIGAAMCLPFNFCYAAYIDSVDVLKYRVYTEDMEAKKDEETPKIFITE